jgi:hypothetical protein
LVGTTHKGKEGEKGDILKSIFKIDTKYSFVKTTLIALFTLFFLKTIKKH